MVMETLIPHDAARFAGPPQPPTAPPIARRVGRSGRRSAARQQPPLGQSLRARLVLHWSAVAMRLRPPFVERLRDAPRSSTTSHGLLQRCETLLRSLAKARLRARAQAGRPRSHRRAIRRPALRRRGDQRPRARAGLPAGHHVLARLLDASVCAQLAVAPIHRICALAVWIHRDGPGRSGPAAVRPSRPRGNEDLRPCARAHRANAAHVLQARPSRDLDVAGAPAPRSLAETCRRVTTTTISAIQINDLGSLGTFVALAFSRSVTITSPLESSLLHFTPARNASTLSGQVVHLLGRRHGFDACRLSGELDPARRRSFVSCQANRKEPHLHVRAVVDRTTLELRFVGPLRWWRE